MPRKLCKHLSFVVRILYFVTVGGTICYFGCDGIQKNEETVKIYKVTEHTKSDASGAATPSSPIEDGRHSNLNHQKDVETVDIQTPVESISSPSKEASSDNADPSVKSEELAQYNSEPDIPQKNNAELAKEKAEQERARIQAKIRAVKASLSEQQNALEEVKKKYNVVEEDIDQRNYTLAERLNSLSAEEQRAYFEEEYLSGKAAAEQFISAFFERLKSKAASQNYSEQAEKLIEQMKQGMPKISDEERINQHIEKLREYGFKPKF